MATRRGRPPAASRVLLYLPVAVVILLVCATLCALIYRPLGVAPQPVPPRPGTAAAARAIVPQAIMPISRASAEDANRAVPVAIGPNPAAPAFLAALGGGSTFGRAADCLTSAIYYEAANESDDGQRAVAQVVLNRVRHPAYPSSVCGVVWQGSNLRTGCQFSFTCDGSLRRTPSAAGWSRARKVAIAALGGSVYAPVGLSTHYHADYVVPYWQASLTKTAVIGAHIFYRWPRGAGAPAAFTSRYAGVEPNVTARTGAGVEDATLTSGAPTTGEVWAEQPALLKPKMREEDAHKIDSFGLLDFRGGGASAVVSARPSAPEARRTDLDAAVASAVAQSAPAQ